MELELDLNPVEVAVVLIAVAVLVALAVRRISIPYTVALVLLGLVAAEVLRDQHLEITPEVVLVVLLPGLLFEASFRIEFRDLRESIAGVAVLAVPGVLIVAAVVSLICLLYTSPSPRD